MRFCKFVPLDTFSIIQSLRKTSGTSITPSGYCLNPENQLPHLLTLKGKGSHISRSLLGTVPSSPELE